MKIYSIMEYAVRVAPQPDQRMEKPVIEGASIFSTTTARQRKEQEALQADLYEQIGRLQMELEWLKKSCPVTSARNAR